MNSNQDYESIPIRGVMLTLFLCLLLSVWPLPVDVKWFRPEFGFLFVFYWVNRFPFRLGLVFAWVAGAIFDLVTGEILGQQALALTIVTYLIIIFNSQIKRSTIFGEMLLIFLLMLAYLILGLWIDAMMGRVVWTIELVLPALATAMCWPFFVRLMSAYYG